MEGSGPIKAELIVAGVGGQGALFAGQMLAQAAIGRYKHISYMPSYGTEKRGGHSECTVVLSDEEIASPVLDQAQAVLLLDSGQASIYEDRVRPGGLMIVEKAGLTYQPQRTDISFLPVSGLEIAVRSGGAMINNLIMLGVYTQLTQALAADLIVDEIKNQAGDRAAVLTRNTEAFARGLELGKTLSN
jgi:2-oxoglutarate ferredoxin oxidoreductase subunit gamma